MQGQRITPETLKPKRNQAGTYPDKLPEKLQVGILRAGLISCCLGGAILSSGITASMAQLPGQNIDKKLLTENPSGSLSLAIQNLFEDETALPLPARQEREALRGYYIENNGKPLWVGTSRMKSLVKVMRESEREGLQPSAYPIKTLERALRVVHLGEPEAKAQVELYFSAFYLRFSRDLKIGRFLPSKIDPKLYWQKKKLDTLTAMKLVAKYEDFTKLIPALQPQIREYARLKQVLAAFRRIENAGGWPALPIGSLEGGIVKPGEEHKLVPALRKRLKVTDQKLRKSTEIQDLIYDADLADAVKRFQKMHGLEPDGVVGKRTLFALNISVTDRIRQIIVTMERWRWMPENLGKNHILVNIAGYQLKRVSNNRVVDVMRVAVGKPYHQSPVFSDKIEYLEFNPYWNVPRSIAVKEELPKLKSNPAARAARGFEAVIGKRAVPLTAIDWSTVSPGNFKYRLRQKPGSNNALGRVKFMFPNRFNVYMHDTPSRGLFKKAQRAFSHGCIRLARPIDLAEQLLKPVSGWNRTFIDQTIASRERTVVKLPKPLPVHLTYSTVWLDGDGEVQFRPDIYRRDAKLEKALSGRFMSF